MTKSILDEIAELSSVPQDTYFKKEDLEKLDKGTPLVLKGEYVASVPSTIAGYGDSHRFLEVDENKSVVLSGGHMDYLVDNGRVQLGQVYAILWDGYVKSKKKGFSAAKTYDPKPWPKAKLQGYESRVLGATSVPAAPVTTDADALDDLA